MSGAFFDTLFQSCASTSSHNGSHVSLHGLHELFSHVSPRPVVWLRVRQRECKVKVESRKNEKIRCAVRLMESHLTQVLNGIARSMAPSGLDKIPCLLRP